MIKSKQIGFFKGQQDTGGGFVRTSGQYKESYIDQEESKRRCQALQDEVAACSKYTTNKYANLKYVVDAEKVAQLMKKKGLLATHVVVSAKFQDRTLHNALAGNRIKLSTLKALAKALGVSEETITKAIK